MCTKDRVTQSAEVISREGWWGPYGERHKDTGSLCNSLVLTLQEAFFQYSHQIIDMLRPSLRIIRMKSMLMVGHLLSRCA